MTKLFLNST